MIEKGKEKMKNSGLTLSRKAIWIIFFGLLAILSGTISGISYVLTYKLWTLSIGAVFAVVIAVTTLLLAWTQIPEKHEWIIEILGSYIGKPLNSGLHFIFPYFDLVHIRAKVYTGTLIMDLYMDESVKEGYGGGAVDFKDGSASVVAKVLFHFADSAKATYEIGNPYKGIEERMDAALRAYLSKYTIDEASLLRVYFSLPIVFNGIKIKDDDDLAEIKKKDAECKNHKTPVEDDLDKWGVKIDSMVVTDIVLPEVIKELRRKVLEASKEAEAAEFTAKKTVTLAKGEMKADIEIGTGIGMKLKNMSDIGNVRPEDAILLLKSYKLYDNIGDNAVIIDSGTSGSSGSSEGVKFGAGFGKGHGVSAVKEKPAKEADDKEK